MMFCIYRKRSAINNNQNFLILNKNLISGAIKTFIWNINFFHCFTGWKKVLVYCRVKQGNKDAVTVIFTTRNRCHSQGSARRCYHSFYFILPHTHQSIYALTVHTNYCTGSATFVPLQASCDPIISSALSYRRSESNQREIRFWK